MLELESTSPGQTEAVAAALATRLERGDVVTIAGELGAGKTTFVRGACRALGVTEPVTSPTFMIGHRYTGRLDLSHLAFCAKPEYPYDHDHRPRTDEWILPHYVKAGFNVMNLANNPSMYHGLSCFMRSLDVLATEAAPGKYIAA